MSLESESESLIVSWMKKRNYERVLREIVQKVEKEYMCNQ